MVDRNRVTSMRDPAAPSGAINILDIDAKLPKAATGSRYFSAQADGKWVVVNGHKDIVGSARYDNETDAINAAAKKNGMSDDELPEIESDR